MKRIKLPEGARLNPRILAAIGLVAISLISAFALSASSNKSVYVWAANNDLASGSVITSLDVKEMRVFLPQNSKSYLSTKAKVIGLTILRKVSNNELIPTQALSSDKGAPIIRSVPIKVMRNDFPYDLRRGSLVDVYAVPTKDQSGKSETVQIAKSVVIESIDSSSKNFGTDVGLVLKLSDSNVIDFLAASVSAKYVVVRSAI